MLRESRGWNQVELARRSGLTQAAVSKVETASDYEPAWTTVAALEQALGSILYERPRPPSLVRFLASPLAAELEPPLTPDEIDELATVLYGRTEADPPPSEWFRFVLDWRRIRSCRG